MPISPLSVNEASVAGQHTYYGNVFPLVLQTSSAATLADAVEWAKEHRNELKRRVEQHGAILFRGFPLKSAKDFDAFVSAFDLPNFPYKKSLSNAVRVNWTERVFSANEAPANVTIYFHHEMAQTPVFPLQLFFFCQIPAEQRGETPICRSDALYDKLVELCPQFISDCECKGLQYTNVMPSADDSESGMGRSWQSTLEAKTPEEAEARLRSLGYSWQWLADGCLKATTPVLPAVREAAGGRKSFFNQLIAAFQGWKDVRNDPSKAIRFGDGTPLDGAAVEMAAHLAEEFTFDVPWQAGDVAFVDNCLVMHGRRTFVGTRKVLASLASAQSQAFERTPLTTLSGPHRARTRSPEVTA